MSSMPQLCQLCASCFVYIITVHIIVVVHQIISIDTLLVCPHSGQTLTQISRRLGGLFRYTNFPEKYIEKIEKKDPTQDMMKAMEELTTSLSALAPPGASGEKASETEPAVLPPEEAEESDDEFADDSLM